MNIKVTHKERGALYGTMETIELSEQTTVFVINADQNTGLKADGKPQLLSTDNYWVAFEGATLSELMVEAEARGLSDIQPI